MMLAELRSKLIGSGVSDILLPGFIDQDERPARFRPLPQAVYFDCDSVYIRMETVATTGTMRISIDHRIALEIHNEEEMMVAVVSLREQCLNDADGKNSLRELRFWNLTDDDTGLRCAAAQLELMNGQQIFVDPTYHFGIRVGGPQQRDIWRDNWPAAEQALEHVVSLLDGR
jgi:hypothetical protein